MFVPKPGSFDENAMGTFHITFFDFFAAKADVFKKPNYNAVTAIVVAAIFASFFNRIVIVPPWNSTIENAIQKMVFME